MRCTKCGGIMFVEFLMTNEGSLRIYKCITCGRTTDMLTELNKINPPPPPERRGRKPNHVIREIRLKPISKRRKMAR
ncbi:MAG: hypothetical protein ACO2PO_22970 [Candidatus Calescibacterium sp.]|jgi:hypothetical protein